MKKVIVTLDLEIRLVETALRQSVGRAAETTGVSYLQASEIVQQHGYPDQTAMRASLQKLRASKVEAVPEAAAAMTGRTLQTVKVADLHPDPDNPREDLGDIAELAASIQQSGLLQPIVARRHGAALIVVAGHRRLAALQRLAVESTDVIVTGDLRPDDVLALMLIENGQRRDLTPMEEARAFDRLKVSKGWTTDQLAARVGRSVPLVSGRLALLNLSPEQQSLVDAGLMGVTEGAQVGRDRAGTSQGARTSYRFHFGAEHRLAGRARARCKQKHNLRHVRIVGNTACGECWEDVLLADASRTAFERSVAAGRCTVCDQPVHTDDDLDVDLDEARHE